MKIADGVHLIGSGALGACWTHPYDCNVYAVECGDQYLLVDAGVGQDTERLAENLCADEIAPERVRRLLLTHGHLDHAGGARWFRNRLTLEVCASRQTAAALDAGDEEAISLAAAKRAGLYPADFHLDACPVDRVFAGNESFTVGDTVIDVIPTPGHSRDMVSYLIHKQDRLLLFCGDTVFHGGKILLSDVYDCDVPAYGRSIRTLAQHRIDGLYPGHLMWAVNQAHQHIEKAMDYLRRLLLPPNIL